MGIDVLDNAPKERYELLVDGALAGFVQYQLRDGQITMYHTEIEPDYEGEGIGSRLARAALEDVADRGLELVPVCPFIAGYIRRHADDYLDLVTAPMRERVLASG